MSHSEHPPKFETAGIERAAECPRMNVLTNLDGVTSALVQLEGADWFEGQKDPKWRNSSIETAVANSKLGKTSVIYGRGGNRRYPVDEKGEVSFRSKTGEGKRDDEMARSLGFKVE